MKMSTFWIILIVFGVVTVAVGNIFYPQAKHNEDKKAAAVTTWETIASELRSNLDLCREMKKQLANDPPQIPMPSFETGAWQAVSSGSLIINLDADIRQKLIRAYTLINRAKNYQEGILDRSIGVASALSSSGDTKVKLITMLRGVLEELEPSLDFLVTKN